MKRRLPIGIQDFVTIREGEYKYVDKTAQIHHLITGDGKAFFLSRPRRFGKSLLCSTLRSIFEGKRELFSGLAIDSLDWEWKKYPIIHIDLCNENYTNKDIDINTILHNSLEISASALNIDIRGETPSCQFMNIIYDIYRKNNERVVVIIDNYDAPLLINMDNIKLYIEIRNQLMGFYAVLKSADEYIKFIFLTGLTKFYPIDFIHAEMNQISEITLDHYYADICGITQKELECVFEQEIKFVTERYGKNRGNYFEELSRFYGGYRFSEKPLLVFNPSDLLIHFVSNGEFHHCCYDTDMHDYNINLVHSEKKNINYYNDIDSFYGEFTNCQIENMNTIKLLYQYGYLTIKNYKKLGWSTHIYTLGFPNDETRASIEKIC